MRMVGIACGPMESLVPQGFKKLDYCVLSRRFDDQVHVLGRAWKPIRSQSNATDHSVADSLLIEEVGYGSDDPAKIHDSPPTKDFMLRRQPLDRQPRRFP